MTLTVEKIMEKAKTIPEVMDKLPDKEKESAKFCKSYLCNLIYTIVGEQFKEWIHE